MKVNLISSVAGIAALLASPAMATQMQNWQPVPSHAYVYVAPHWAPHAYVYVAPHWAPYAAPHGMAYAPHGATRVAPRVESEFGPYTPSKPAPRYGTNDDFQGGGANK
jgi:hypothetical protein